MTAHISSTAAELREACLYAWMSTETQQPNDELKVSELIADIDSPPTVRLAALDVLSQLISNNRVKGRQSLCQVCYSLADIDKNVVTKAKHVLRSSIIEVFTYISSFFLFFFFAGSFLIII
jgi:hypothetical protein